MLIYFFAWKTVGLLTKLRTSLDNETSILSFEDSIKKSVNYSSPLNTL